MADHGTDDFWKEISEVRSGQAATDARLGALETAVDAGFRTLSSELRNIGERVNRPTPSNNGIYVAIAFGLLGMFGGYALLITNPIHGDLRRLYEANVRQQELNLQDAYYRGKTDHVSKQLESVDNIGSRYRRNE